MNKEAITSEIVHRLYNDEQFAFQENAANLIKGICPQCGKRELFISKEKPWQLKCNRLNHCGFEESVKNIYPDLFSCFSKRYPATDQNPNRTADAFLTKDRGFDLSIIKGWYEQKAYLFPDTNTFCSTVRFYLDKNRTRYWERLIDKTSKDGQKANFGGKRKADGSIYKGDVWSPPDMPINTGDKIFIVEGIFHAIALYHRKYKAVAAFSCNHFPEAFIQQQRSKKLTWILALDGDRAGIEYTLKHAKKLLNLGEKHEIYILPKGQDWDDLLRANKINKKFMEDCKHRGKLLMAKTVEEYTYHKYCKNSAKRFVITFKNRLFSVCIDIAQLTEDLTGTPLEDKNSFPVFISNCTVMEICNRDPQCLYREVDELLGEQWYVFKIQSTNKKPEIVRLEGSNIATADAFHKALLNRTAGGTFSGTPADMRILTKHWLQNELPTVRSIPYIGYDNESQAYIYPAAAFYKGKEIKLDENSFYRVGKDLVRPGLKSIKIITDGKFTPDWFDKFLKTFHWQGLALLAFWIGSLFAHQIRKEQKSFPFFELTGDPGSGKSTMLEFCWKLLGREDYEGFDVMKSTIAGRRRAFNQVSNMPIVIIESDRETRR
ncbi:toprim domain-containing protein [Maridesulfovibrio ferrireducens]|uniref:toprim domain-containing protein n=1 Tax=Maridesulfovibrio ferrireducens TaxID=246191 RepID=UPI000A4726A8|nr:toprim domain-containing protein [Maridesulfovibrio ferrireducens]